MISQTAEYALRAIVCLAEQPELPRTTQEIAARAKIPAGYLAKVMQSLVRARLVSSQRGLRGGFTLRRAPSEMTVLDVVNAVDPVPRIRECPLGLPEHADRLCPLHDRLDQALANIETTFRESKIAEMVGERGSGLCSHPVPPAPARKRARKAKPAPQGRPRS